MREYHLDPNTWYNERELEFTPKHFTVSKTPITIESKLWVLNNLRGRFSITTTQQDDDLQEFFTQLVIVNSSNGHPAFEDPREAVMYELTWS